MKHEIFKHLFDIKTSIDSIYEYLGEERNFQEYQNNKLLRRGVEREIEIIGEAMDRILKADPNCQITDSRKIVDTRNRIIHGYDSVSADVIWLIVNRYLPILQKEVQELLKH